MNQYQQNQYSQNYQQNNNQKSHLKFIIVAIVILAALGVGSVITFNKMKNNNTVAEKAAIEEYGYDIYSYDFDSDYYEAGLSCVYKVVEKNGENQFKYGYVDENKNIVIPCKYDDWSNVYGGEFLILKKEGKYGVLDTQGRTVLDFNYDEIFYDEGNTFTVKTGNKQEKIDTTDIIRWAK